MRRQHRLGRWVGWVLRLLGATWRIEVVGGSERITAIQSGDKPVIFAFWHDRAPVCAWALRHWFLSRGVPLTVLVSQSRDGELGAGLAKGWGADVVRGSTSRGGAASLRRLYRAVTKSSNAVTIPDGPRGPLHRAKPGAVVLAQMTGAAIQPVAIAASRAWRIRSWDRMIFPQPFARVRVAFGPPVTVPSDLAGLPPTVAASAAAPSLEDWQRHLSHILDTLVQQVEHDSPDRS